MHFSISGPSGKEEPEPSEPFFRNRSRNRPSVLNCIETLKNPPSDRDRWQRKPEPFEPFHPQTITVTEPGPPFRKMRVGGG